MSGLAPRPRGRTGPRTYVEACLAFYIISFELPQGLGPLL